MDANTRVKTTSSTGSGIWIFWKHQYLDYTRNSPIQANRSFDSNNVYLILAKLLLPALRSTSKLLTFPARCGCLIVFRKAVRHVIFMLIFQHYQSLIRVNSPTGGTTPTSHSLLGYFGEDWIVLLLRLWLGHPRLRAHRERKERAMWSENVIIWITERPRDTG